MQILSIHLKNIKSHRDTELTFSAGINVLSGPNGVGKSTVFEAIGYALFGVDAKDFVSNVDRFLTIGTKKGAISVVLRGDDGETYRVSRTVGAAAKWLLAKEIGGSFEVEDHARMEETEARVAEILGLANGRPLAEQFKLVIGPFQNDFLGPFVIKQATKRQEAFDEILGIDAWRKTYKGTATLLSAVQKRIEILAVEVAGKQEQLVVLPVKTAELATIKNDLTLRQQELNEQDALLATLDARLVEQELQEKGVVARNNEVQLLQNRITDGTAKIAEQKLRVEESRTALKVVADSTAGKDAFDRLEANLVGLRQKGQQRRVLELDIAALEKEALRLTQLLLHERSEIEKNGAQLDAEQEKINSARTELLPDAQLSATAARLPVVRSEIETQRGGRALLDGRREGLLEGKEKLAEGVCPFFQEQCRNIAGSAPRDVFTGRITELDRHAAERDELLAQLARQLTEAEAAEKELNSRSIRLQELDKQAAGLEERRNRNNGRGAALGSISTQQIDAAKKVETRRADLNAFADLDTAVATAEKERQQHQAARDAYTANLNVATELDPRAQKLQKMQQLLEGLNGELTAKQAELDAVKSSFQPELLRHSRLEKERLLAGTATLRQQIVDLGRNGERLTGEIAQLNTLLGEVAVKQAEMTSYAEKENWSNFCAIRSSRMYPPSSPNVFAKRSACGATASIEPFQKRMKSCTGATITRSS